MRGTKRSRAKNRERVCRTVILTNMHRSPFQQIGFRRSEDGGGSARHFAAESDSWFTGRIGMWLLFSSLAMLFMPLLIVYGILRLRYPTWPPPGIHSPTGGFLLATAILLGVSGALHVSLQRIRGGRLRTFRGYTLLALGLAIAFVLCQIGNWLTLFAGAFTDETWPVIGFLYFFTGVHALHVIGGVVPLTLVAMRANRYSPANHNGPRYVTMYWHFLDGVWLIMLAAFITP